MKYIRAKDHRRSVRLKNYDYSGIGAYYITICAWNRESVFGEIVNGEMCLNKYGERVRDEWKQTEYIRPNVEMDEFIVMPNHLHGIVVINAGNTCRGRLQRAPTYEQFGKPVSNSIPTIIRLFKSSITKSININRKTPGMPVWQRNYFEHVIRTENEMYQTIYPKQSR